MRVNQNSKVTEFRTVHTRKFCPVLLFTSDLFFFVFLYNFMSCGILVKVK